MIFSGREREVGSQKLEIGSWKLGSVEVESWKGVLITDWIPTKRQQ
jgi:hypothetical protein